MKKALALIWILLNLPAFACQCDSISTSLNKQTVSSYDLIFYGKVTKVASVQHTGLASFSIDKIFQGKSYQNIDLSFDNQSSCAMSFSPDEEWIVYAKYISYGHAEIVFCSPSRKKMSSNTDDYYSMIHGKSFEDELIWLEKEFGIKELNRSSAESPRRELLHPVGMERLWLYLGGLLGLALIWFLTRKFLR
jgi:hypothetical protein